MFMFFSLDRLISIPVTTLSNTRCNYSFRNISLVRNSPLARTSSSDLIITVFGRTSQLTQHRIPLLFPPFLSANRHQQTYSVRMSLLTPHTSPCIPEYTRLLLPHLTEDVLSKPLRNVVWHLAIHSCLSVDG